MKYALSVEVKLSEVPDDEPLPTARPGNDPMAALGGIATKIMSVAAPRAFNFGQQAGFDFRKQTEVAVTSFDGLAQIIARFVSLVEDIEAEKLQVNP